MHYGSIHHLFYQCYHCRCKVEKRVNNALYKCEIGRIIRLHPLKPLRECRKACNQENFYTECLGTIYWSVRIRVRVGFKMGWVQVKETKSALPIFYPTPGLKYLSWHQQMGVFDRETFIRMVPGKMIRTNVAEIIKTLMRPIFNELRF